METAAARPAASRPSVEEVRVWYQEPDPQDPGVAEAFRIVTEGQLTSLPLSVAVLQVIIGGVPLQFPHALQRAMMDEIPGCRLTFDSQDFTIGKTTDPFMIEQWVLKQIQLIPLRPRLAPKTRKELRFRLQVENPTPVPSKIYAKDLVLVQGDLSEPIFNPTPVIALLHPGRSLNINNIRAEEGLGKTDASFSPAISGTVEPLDIPEIPAEELARSPLSGFTQSSLEANPRRHRLRIFVPAVPRVDSAVPVSVLEDACADLIGRLRYIKEVLQKTQESRHHVARRQHAQFIVTPAEVGSKGVLIVPEETRSISEVLSRSVYETMPEVASVLSDCIPHEKEMRLTVSHRGPPEDIPGIFTRATDYALQTFETILQEVRAAPVQAAPPGKGLPPSAPPRGKSSQS